MSIAAGSGAWGAAMGASVLFSLMVSYGRPLGPNVYWLLGVCFGGGFLAFAVTRLVLPWLARLPPALRFGLTTVVLGCGTLAATAGLYALNYRTYYAQWHEPAFSRIWFWEQLFTAAGSTYQFTVLGFRLYWPLGPVFLIATSWWLSRKAG